MPPAKYPLQDLLRVRLFREDAAQAEVTTARRKVEDAEQQILLREQELADYVQLRERREQEIYDEVFQQEVQVRDLDDLKMKIQILRYRQSTFEDAVTQAKRDLVAAQQTLEAAVAAHATAAKERRKIDEHKGIWAQEEAKRCEAEAEKELEDFRVRKDL